MKQIRISYRMIKKFLFLFLIFLFCLIASLRILQSSHWLQQSHYVILANSFLHLRLDLPSPLPYTAEGDVALFEDKYFVYFGPLPAILLVPLVAVFKELMSQHLLGLTFLFIDFFLFYRIAKKLILKGENSFWLSLFIVFGSVFSFLGLINLTAYQVQIIAVSFLIFALYEFFHRRRWLLIGIFLAMAGSTRPTLYLASIFFIIELLNHTQKRLQNFLYLILPILVSIILLGVYNFLRFDNVFETGYSYHATLGPDLKSSASKGFFSFEHIPTNLFFLIFKGPDPVRANNINYQLQPPYLRADQWGMGIFFTSPLFLYIFLSKLKKGYILSSWITVLLMLIPTLTFFGTGVSQYGFRYAVDFYPFLFIILASIFKTEIPLMAKALIIYSIFFNFFFLLSPWGIYPFRF